MLIKHDSIKEIDEVYFLIDWPRIEQLLRDAYYFPGGNKARPPNIMFRSLLLQSCYKLSDDGLEKQWSRDLLSRRCSGLDISALVADNRTIWRSRKKLNKENLLNSLLYALNNQLAEQGLYMEDG